MLKAVIFKKPVTMLGRSIKVYLKDRANDKAAFYFWVREAGTDYISGTDAEGMNLRISMEDIDFVIGG